MRKEDGGRYCSDGLLLRKRMGRKKMGKLKVEAVFTVRRMK